MTDVAVRMSGVGINGTELIGDKEFDEFLQLGAHANGFPSESKDDIESHGTNGAIRNGGAAGGASSAAGANDRIKWKAKRPSKFVLSRTNSDSMVTAPLRALKNSRKSRNRFGRGLPKKGGAGGKGTWGALGSEVLEEDVDTGTEDPNDPNYDDLNPDSKDIKMKVTEVDASAKLKAKIIPSDEEICKWLHTCILEYYDHGDTEEAYLAIEELKWKDEQRLLLVITAIEVAMDHKPSHREMTSVLLADLYHYSLREEHYQAGYDKLIKNLDDLVIDTPAAPTILGNFVARSVADDCIPPKFLSGYIGQLDSNNSALCLRRAQSLLSMRHGLVRLDAVWGLGGATRPVKHLIKKMNLLLHEYLSSADEQEAQRCLIELEVPHFHHELVYEAVVLAMEKLDDRTLTLIARLLAALHASVVVTPNQMKEGFFRVFEDLPQITLDVPAAPIILEKIVKRCLIEKIIPDDVARKMPARSRKRFVSEGDGGRIKDDYC
uniref:Programmed cell death protein 4 n=1 Tax=Hirondellea gigas TaxID=1518452 RepID=A0A2P2I200_9CRUS